jgi:hypothetical protein
MRWKATTWGRGKHKEEEDFSVPESPAEHLVRTSGRQRPDLAMGKVG